MPAAPPLYSTHCALQSRLLCTGDCIFLCLTPGFQPSFGFLNVTWIVQGAG